MCLKMEKKKNVNNLCLQVEGRSNLLKLAKAAIPSCFFLFVIQSKVCKVIAYFLGGA